MDGCGDVMLARAYLLGRSSSYNHVSRLVTIRGPTYNWFTLLCCW